MKYDILIKSHPSDYSKLKFCINSIKYLNPTPENIYILTPTGYKPDNTDFDDLIVTIKDEEATPLIDKNKINYRPNWCWSSLITLFQDFTKNDLYLELQSDSFFIKNVDLFDGDKPIIYTTSNSSNNNIIHSPYFDFSNNVFGINKVVLGRSFITEFLMFNRNHTKHLIKLYGSFELMMEKVYSSISENCYPSNQEIFGNMIETKYIKNYSFIHDINVVLDGQSHLNPVDENFIANYIENAKNNNPNAISCSYHSWSIEK